MKKEILAVVMFFCVMSGKAQMADVFAKKLPAVVTVAIYKSGSSEHIFGFGNDAKTPVAYQKILDLSGAKSSGSGFVIQHKLKKYVITNAHVINSASDEDGAVVCYSIDRTKYEMRIVGGDSFYDIAVLEFVGKQPGPEIATFSFREKELRVGDNVYSIGNPLGNYPYSVTDGILSAKNRTLKGLTAKYGYLQHTATVIWGNSGGPLVDTEGNVAGINTRIEIAQNGVQNYIQPQINFALDGELAKRLIDDILSNNGRVKRPYFGVMFSEKVVSDELYYANIDGYSINPVVEGVIEGSPASNVLDKYIGAKIVQINGNEIGNLQDALGEMEQINAGDEVRFTLSMKGKESNVSFKAGELTVKNLEVLGSSFVKQYFGLTVKEKSEAVAFVKSGGKGSVSTLQSPKMSEESRKQFEDYWETYEPLLKDFSKEEVDSIKIYYQKLFMDLEEDNDYRYSSREAYERQAKKDEGLFSATETIVVAIGADDGYGLGGNWSVKSLSDLGAALRIGALSGTLTFYKESYYDLYYFDDAGMNIESASGEHIKVLLY